MSRIGREPIPVPDKVQVDIDGRSVKVKGPKGELTFEHHIDMTVKLEDGEVKVTRPSDHRDHRSLHGLTRALINNMVVGVTDGYTKVLEINGTGYRAELQGKSLKFELGFSHSIVVDPP